ncbi:MULTISPECIES: glycosyltransferase [Pseudomonas]|uniref:Beta-monoglucosyldiacylglycerol synthase n=1 Tax=Pseudomonas kribbensis TaxID=1628086 RepID=A0A4Y8VJR9_9PSED|nr:MULTISPECIES: glycosyltransferase [Pseudomonas]TFH80697.1 glycosyltransferase [Pseudomonas kribbensis]
MESLYFSAIFYCVGGFALLVRFQLTSTPDRFWVWWWGAGLAISAFLKLAVTGSFDGVMIPTAGGLLLSLYARFRIPILSFFGIGWLACRFCLPISVLVLVNELVSQWGWSKYFLSELTLYLAQVVAFPLSVLYILCSTLSELPRFTIVYHKRDRALEVMRKEGNSVRPMVSIHVPCYAEPPDLVIGTLKAISRLDYENFEVLVIDNNTKDERLWRPVEAYCQLLGDRFRFFHIDPISGAKAGAINFALRNTNPDAEIIAVIDADYVAYPDFLSRFVPLFNDESTGFIQTSHDYRQWRENPFLSSVYFHYLIQQKTVHPALNEYGAGCLVGTMCLIRRSILDELGGWAEWSLTEDLELAVRIMALGYTGHVFAETWGRGLIPETMEGVKKQQFRWWAGATQEFMVHWRWYLGFDESTSLSVPQRSFRVLAFFKDFIRSIILPANMLLFLVCVYSILNDKKILLPAGVLLLMASLLLVLCIKIWIGVRKLNGQGVKDYFLTIMIKGALRWTAIVAFVVPVFKVSMPWVRTNKFKEAGNFSRAIKSTSVEVTIALVHCALALIILPYGDFVNFDLLAVSTIWMIAQGLLFMCAFVMAVTGEKALDVII